MQIMPYPNTTAARRDRLNLSAAMAMALALATNSCNSILSIEGKFSRPSFSYGKISSRRLRQRRFVICSSVETASSEDLPESSMESKSDSTASVAPPQTFSSLINPANIRKAFAGVEVVAADHYGRLGIPRGASYAQVTDAFKSKCEDLMRQGLDEETSRSKLQDLKESFEILSSEEERRFYDWSIARSENPERYTWPYEVDITQRSTTPGPPQKEDDEGPTKKVAYFFLGWLVLSFILSATLK